MRERFARFMYGRYGNDQLGRFLSIFSLVILILGMILGAIAGQGLIVLSYIGSILYYFALIILFLNIFRMFSKKIEKRRAENYKYNNLKNKVQSKFRQIKNRFAQRKTHRFYPCPKCGAVARVPKGKGKIKIKCPKCANTYIRKS